MSGSRQRVGALLLRYGLVMRRDAQRILEIVYWPFIDIVIWGFLTYFVAATGAHIPNALGVFVGGALLWNVYFRAANEVPVAFLEDVWSRSLVTLFASPLTVREFSVAVLLTATIKVVLTFLVMSVLAALFYAFDVFTFGWALVPFAVNLTVFGWVLGLLAMAIVIRFGSRWAILAWSLPFLVQPVSSVFYPEAVLPRSLRIVAQAIPANHIFEGMRTVLFDGRVPWDRVLLASVENVVYLVAAVWLVTRTFGVALDRGLLPKVR